MNMALLIIRYFANLTGVVLIYRGGNCKIISRNERSTMRLIKWR